MIQNIDEFLPSIKTVKKTWRFCCQKTLNTFLTESLFGLKKCLDAWKKTVVGGLETMRIWQM